MPTEQTQVVLEHMHGAASRVPVEQTAFGLRRVHYSINIMPAWTDPAMAEKCIDLGAGASLRLSTAFGASDAYVNYLGDEGPSAVKASYGANYARLAAPQEKIRSRQFLPLQPEHRAGRLAARQMRQVRSTQESVIARIGVDKDGTHR